MRAFIIYMPGQPGGVYIKAEAVRFLQDQDYPPCLQLIMLPKAANEPPVIVADFNYNNICGYQEISEADVIRVPSK